MRTRLHALFVLGGIVAISSLACCQSFQQFASRSDVALNYDLSRSNTTGGNGFAMQGGSTQFHFRCWRGLGAVADFAGSHDGNMYSSGVGLDLFTTTFGPRYMWSLHHPNLAFYGQVLAGRANGMNSVFPQINRATSSASSLALLAGGGIRIPLSRRVMGTVESDWLRTQLPNSTTNVQNSLRLCAGIVFRFK